MKLDAILPYLLPDVPAVPDITAKQALLMSAIEFCVQTHAWDEILDPLLVEHGVNEYDIEVAQGSRVAAVKSVWIANNELQPVTMPALQLRIPNWQTATGSVPAFYTAPVDNSTIKVYPIPENPVETYLTIRVAYAPTLSATSIPDSVINRYLEVLVAGAKHRLMMTPGKSWSNLQLAAVHKATFDDGIIRAKVDVLHDEVQGSIKVRPMRFGL